LSKDIIPAVAVNAVAVFYLPRNGQLIGCKLRNYNRFEEKIK